MIYEFRSADGERYDMECSMDEAPDMTAVVTKNGKVFRRVLSYAPPLVRRDCRIVSHSQPRFSPDHKGEFDKAGKPVFTSWNEVDRYTGTASDRGDETTYDSWKGA